MAHCAGQFLISLTQTSHLERGNFNVGLVSMRLACRDVCRDFLG